MNNKEVLSRRTFKVLPEEKNLINLMNKRPVKVYLGIDPTATRLHIGHSIAIRKLMDFANSGHEAILLFGTGTVLVGDPSLRKEAREQISEATIDENIKTWKEQIAPIVDFDKVTIMKNGDWITPMTIKDIIELGSQVSATQLFKRESFTRRIEQGGVVYYHETLYPLLQGYDSVQMEVDAEIGGTDQEFNMLMGRELLKKVKNKEKYVVEVPMILGTDGQQMSKSTGNCVWLDDEPNEMYGKLMSIPDDQIIQYLELCTDLNQSEIDNLKSEIESGNNPRDIKARMAQEVTAVWHDEAKAGAAADFFDSRFRDKDHNATADEVDTKTGDRNVVDLIIELEAASSKSEARRLLEQGAIKRNDNRIEADTIEINSGDIFQIGKRKVYKIR